MERANMTTVELKLEVPQRLARQAEAAGLLTSRSIKRLLTDALRRSAADRLLAGARRASRHQAAPASLRAIQREVHAVRSKRRRSR